MPIQTYSLFQNDVTIKSVEVELHTRFQIPSFHILGLPAPEIQEARERIMAAFSSSDLEFPKQKVMVNLTPSSERKSGTGHDLAIAIKILEQVIDLRPPSSLKNKIYAWGELGLDGKIKSCGHMAKWVELIFHENIEILFLSKEDHQTLTRLIQWRKEKSLPVPLIPFLIEVNSLNEVADHLTNDLLSRGLRSPKQNLSERAAKETASQSLQTKPPPEVPCLLPLSPSLERVIKIALVGRHHLLILGPKGTGKSQALDWLKALAPDPKPSQTWERLLLSDQSFDPVQFRLPIRRVHAQIRPSHLLGSWNNNGFHAGELSNAHGGILIADEFLEWPRDAKECLREPLEQKRYGLTRKQGTVQLSCDVQFIGTGNLCPCGGLPHPYLQRVQGRARSKQLFQKCSCKASVMEHYLNRLSGPVADRIDLVYIHAEAPNGQINYLDQTEIVNHQNQIQQSQDFCIKKNQGLSSSLGVVLLEEKVKQVKHSEAMLHSITSLRARHKVMRIACTIQALERNETLKPEHLMEAITYRFEGIEH